MSHRSARVWTLLAASLLGTSGTAAALQASPPPTYPAENFIVIVLDDVGTDKLSLYDGNVAPPYAATPRLDQLASQGVRFTSFYVNPYCSTTRACLQTGRYAFRHGIGGITATITSLAPNLATLQACEESLAELLKYGFPSGGPVYTCGAFGKWHMTWDLVVPGQYLTAQGDEEHAVRDNGYDCYRGMMSNVGMVENDDHFEWRKVAYEPGHTPMTITRETRWSGTVVREDAVEWINRQPGRYLAYVAFNPPHAPLQVPPYDLISDATRGALDALTPGDPDDTIDLGDPRHSAPGPHGALYYRAMLEAVDEEIGNLLDAVKQANPAKYKKTLVCVMSDNGTPSGVIQSPHDSAHGKGTVYGIGVRVPLIVSGSPVPLGSRGATSDGLVNAVDLWPTIKHYSGATSSRAIDGVSFRSLIENPSALSQRPVAFSQQFSPNWYPLTTYDCFTGHERSITDGEFKLVRKQTGSQCAILTSVDEFYHLPSDPEEANDLIAIHAAHPILGYLRAQMNLLVPPTPLPPLCP